MKKQKVKVNVTTIPHPNPEAGINLIAQLIVNELLKRNSIQPLKKAN